MKRDNNPRMNTNEHEFFDLTEEVKKKKEFSGLPDSVVERAIKEIRNKKLEIRNEFLVKDVRKLLRKYFGVFLTNRVLKKKGNKLDVHLSSKKRDYEKFYGEIFLDIKNVGSVVDLGCGVNGFSYGYLRDIVSQNGDGSSDSRDVEYVGIEAAGQLINQMNVFFEDKGFDAEAIRGDLFDLDLIRDTLRRVKKDRMVFLFQVVDALESVERNFSLKLIGEIMKSCEVLIISVPLVSLGGGKKFAVKRKWLMDYLVENFRVERDFEMFGERVFVVRNRL